MTITNFVKNTVSRALAKYAETHNNTALSARVTANEQAISALTADAPAALDTLKEIADWIAADETGTAALVGRVGALENAAITVDSALNNTSENPVQNKAVVNGINQALGTVESALYTKAEISWDDSNQYMALSGGSNNTLVFTDTTDGVNVQIVRPGEYLSGGELAKKEYVDARINALGADDHVELTQAEYDALTTEEKNNGKVYFVTDGQAGGGSGGTALRKGSFTASSMNITWETDDTNYIEFFIRRTFNVDLTRARGSLFGTSIEFSSYITDIANNTGIQLQENATILDFACWAQRSDRTPIITSAVEVRVSFESFWYRTLFVTMESTAAAPTDITWRIKVALS